ncbi:interferon-induced, double-stranded RNA-activated protein kinase [Folsomia candida]|uniref:non-specific serine/threonine protein kinase n=1 Tax=Folsomia candida TaxID=158441 RepID=A0A226EP01_FOLCA|nr:interferon-induced, double-stranded RNA-activated protein kinase [Folsomia candida]OXA59373.1 Interferon-induced, double-stranded RNA-activated protein kinase [Folsomia candida]
MAEPVNLEHIKVLLQDTTFLNEWKQVSDALGIPARDLFSMNSKLNSGNATMYDVIQWMLETWRGRNGNEVATVAKLISVLESEDLRNAADLLKDFSKRSAASTPQTRPIPIEMSTQDNAASEGMQQRNLVVLERLDQGTFSEVFKVRSIFDNKEYAIKRISVGQFLLLTKTSGAADAFEFFSKFMREVLVMAKLPEHPNIVAYREAWFEGTLQQTLTEWLRRPESMPPPTPVLKDAPKRQIVVTEAEKNTFMCIKMELMDTNLSQWYELHPDRIGDFETTKTITKQILCGLASIHGRKIIHRDLKPNNILLNLRGNEIIVKIGDFGLSREMPAVDTSLTMQVGGRSFSSPEMERGDDDYTFKTDIFSVGLIVLVTLHSFATAKEVERTLDDVRRGEHGILDRIEATHQRQYGLLRAMLSRKPDQRPTAEEALKSL